jgi:Tol biopolymer transport system component
VLLYTYGNGELTNIWQALTLGADGDVYRQLDAAGNNGGFQQWLLSPDGRSVILADKQRPDGALTIVDLATGGQREVRLPEFAGVTLLAISPDGRHVAYASAPPPADTEPIGAIAQETARVGRLTIIDLATGRSTLVPGLRPVQAAAFSPDGLRLVVQSALQTWIVTRDGQLERQVRLPTGTGIVSRNAWSPDWRTIAVTTWRAESWQQLDGTTTSTYIETPGTISVYDIIHGRDLRNDVVPPQKVADGVFLGWRPNGRLLTLTGEYSAGDEALVEVRGDGGPPTVLSRFDPGSTCELGMQTCMVLDLTVAAGLLQEVTVRPAGAPDRGPWPLPLRLAGAAALALAVGAGWLIWRWARHRRRGRPAA